MICNRAEGLGAFFKARRFFISIQFCDRLGGECVWAGPRGLPVQCGCQSRTGSLRRRERDERALTGDARDPAEQLAREMQKAAEERPLIGERKGPYAIGRTPLATAWRRNRAQLK